MRKPKKNIKSKRFIADHVIWNNFERFRAERGWTYAEVAREMEVSPQHLAQIKAGTLGIGPETLAKMVKALGKTENEFLETDISTDRLFVPREIVAIYPRATFFVGMLFEAAKAKPTAERLLEYAIDLAKAELDMERMRNELARHQQALSPRRQGTKK